MRCDPLTSPSHDRPASGFTLLELLVVVAIIGLLVAYVGPRYIAQMRKSERGVARAQIEAFTRALNTYRIDVGRFPADDEGLDALLTPPTGTTQWNGPYLEKNLPLDPWGQPYRYRSTPDTDEIEISSFGKDGRSGGSGDAADISSRE